MTPVTVPNGCKIDYAYAQLVCMPKLQSLGIR